MTAASNSEGRKRHEGALRAAHDADGTDSHTTPISPPVPAQATAGWYLRVNDASEITALSYPDGPFRGAQGAFAISGPDHTLLIRRAAGIEHNAYDAWLEAQVAVADRDDHIERGEN